MILDARGNPITIERIRITQELASFASATGSSMELLPDPDPVLRKKGEDARVLEALAADDQVTMAMQLRKRKVLVKGEYGFAPWQPEKGKQPVKTAKSLCDTLIEDLTDIALKPVFTSMIDANFYGYTVFELMWRIEGKRLRLTGVVEKPRHWFGFDGSGKLVFFENGQQREVPYGKFLVVRHEPTYQNPYGLRLLSRCLWPVAFKQAGIEWCMRFLEKYGMPWQIAKAPQNYDNKQRQDLAAQLAAMVQDAVAVLPFGAEHTLAQTSSAGDARFLEFLKFWNSAISKVLSCQTQSSEVTGTGTYASSKTHYEVLADVATADELLVCDGMNDLAGIYTTLNASAEPPVFAFNEPEDYDAQAELDKKRYAVGVRFTKAHFARYGLEEDEFYLVEEQGAAPEAGKNGEEKEGKKEFSAPGDEHQAALDDVINRALPRALAADEEKTAAIKDLIQGATDYETLTLGLLDLVHADLDRDELPTLIEEMVVAAHMYGRFAVGDEE